MSKTIKIDPVTRIEGHARVLLDCDDNGKVEEAFFCVNELRGFERILVGMQAHTTAPDHRPHLRRLPDSPPSGRGQGPRSRGRGGRFRRRPDCCGNSCTWAMSSIPIRCRSLSWPVPIWSSDLTRQRRHPEYRRHGGGRTGTRQKGTAPAESRSEDQRDHRRPGHPPGHCGGGRYFL